MLGFPALLRTASSIALSPRHIRHRAPPEDPQTVVLQCRYLLLQLRPLNR